MIYDTFSQTPGFLYTFSSAIFFLFYKVQTVWIGCCLTQRFMCAYNVKKYVVGFEYFYIYISFLSIYTSLVFHLQYMYINKHLINSLQNRHLNVFYRMYSFLNINRHFFCFIVRIIVLIDII